MPLRHRCSSRKAVSWAIDTRQTTNLMLNALDMAAVARKPSQTAIHSDHVIQFIFSAFSSRFHEEGLFGSMETIGEGYDNAMIASFWGTMRVEPHPKEMACTARAAKVIFEYTEGYYNRFRHHSAHNWESATAFEAQGSNQKISA